MGALTVTFKTCPKHMATGAGGQSFFSAMRPKGIERRTHRPVQPTHSADPVKECGEHRSGNQYEAWRVGSRIRRRVRKFCFFRIGWEVRWIFGGPGRSFETGPGRGGPPVPNAALRQTGQGESSPVG